jgi:hypothetical protein
VRYLRLEPNADIPPYDGPKPFAAIVAIEADVTREWQWQVSRWLVDTGCLYMLAWGRDCSSWDDSVDYANLETFSYGDIPEERSVMTTWHENETLSEVFDFVKRHMKPASDTVQLRDTVLLHISSIEKGQQYALLFAAA